MRVTLEAPLDFAASLAPLGRWGDDGIDRWDGTKLVRTARVGGRAVPYAARPSVVDDAPGLDVAVAPDFMADSAEMAAHIRASFVAVPAGLDALVRGDPQVARLVRLYPGVRPILVPDPFSSLIRSISAQQVNLPWAATVRRRIAERYGTRHEVAGTYVYSLEAGPLARASVDELRELQLTAAKARSVIAVAGAAVAGELERHDLDALDDEALIAHLTRLPGIGHWSAEWFLARTLGRPRVVAGDLGVRKAVGRMYATQGLPTEREVRRLTAHWDTAATVVQALALHDLVGGRARA